MRIHPPDFLDHGFLFHFCTVLARSFADHLRLLDYQFNICKTNIKSPIGRTKTIPSKNDKLRQNVKLAVFSCSNHPFGYFNAYGNVARKDSVDYVVHLGDYIYEYNEGAVSYSRPVGCMESLLTQFLQYGWGYSLDRKPQPDKQIVSLYDYRKRIAQYRTDKDLLLSHQQFPWIPVWDDHGKSRHRLVCGSIKRWLKSNFLLNTADTSNRNCRQCLP